MNTGKTVKIHKNVPEVIPVQIPITRTMPKKVGDTSEDGEIVPQKEFGIPLPIRREEKVIK